MSGQGGGRVNNIMTAKQTIDITSKGYYEKDGEKIMLPALDYDYVKVISPSDGESILEDDVTKYYRAEMCTFSVTNEDSFRAARRYEKPLVLNFANAHSAGGAFLLGANAQEEALCRCSTLYDSIRSAAASEMYIYNNTHLSAVESDYMLLSPEVCVFRDENCELLDVPFIVSVMTAPAPNRRGAALFASQKKITETFMRRMRIIMSTAAAERYRTLILGAWGCGAFGNPPEDVSECFYNVLVNEEYGRCFDSVCFAVYGADDGANITAFRRRFSDL